MLFAKRLLAVLAGLLALSVAAPATAYHENGNHPLGDPRFEERRDRTERPVLEGHVDRTWIWGPSPYTELFTEPYADSPGGERTVQYFDKSRMEINHPEEQGLWSVTNGLLVVEMIEGAVQLGNDEFDTSVDPADVQIAGDAAGAESPTYADIASFGLQEVDPLAEGTVIDQYLAMTTIESSSEYAAYGIEASYHVSETNHTVAEPFWDFMNATGLIWEDGNLVADNLFQNPFYSTGYPVTEAYWTTTPVDGESQDVMWQCFERRCLTFTPENPDGWQVETGNVGQHYYEWRHGDDDDANMEDAQIFLIDQDGTDEGTDIGMGETLVGVDVQIPEQEDVEGRISASLHELFPYEHETLYNAWTSSDTDVVVDSVTMTEELATVHLSGEIIPVGDLSDVWLNAQLEGTATQFDGVEQAVALLDGGPLTEPLATPADGVIAIFDVTGEHFRLWVTNDQTISDLEAMHAGALQGHFPYGPFSDDPPAEGAANVPWDWHLDPEETDIVDSAPAACDATPSEVQAGVEWFISDIGTYCPSDSELIDLVDYRDI